MSFDMADVNCCLASELNSRQERFDLLPLPVPWGWIVMFILFNFKMTTFEGKEQRNMFSIKGAALS